jgi:hypothetical protein
MSIYRAASAHYDAANRPRQLTRDIGFLVTVVTLLSLGIFYFWRSYRLKDIETQELDSLCITRAKLINKLKREVDKQAEIIAEQRSFNLG